jgi:thiamin-phosphate kinase
MIKEMTYIHNLIKAYPRAQGQLNHPFLSDAEVIPMGNGFLGVSIDAVSEELEMGLLLDPTSLGWVTVTASVSDLSAIGFKTERVSAMIRTTASKEWQDCFFRGVEEACQTYCISEIEKIDSVGSELSACTAYGWSSQKPRLSRLGLEAGDTLFLTGPIGWGNATAFANLALRRLNPGLADQIDQSYRPQARWREGLMIQDFAKVCIDTSDGLLSTLKWLEILNSKKIEFIYDKTLFHPRALEVAHQANVNPWLFLAAQNGEFELLFSIPKARALDFSKACQEQGMKFLEVGRVKEGLGMTLLLPNQESKDRELPLNLDTLLDMLHDGVEPQLYISKMLQFAKEREITMEGWS